MMDTVPVVYQPAYLPLRHANGRALLQEGRTLVIIPLLDIALLVDWHGKRIVAGCTFFEEELLLLLPILQAWPSFVPYPRLLALLDIAQIPDPVQEAAIGQRYQEALARGVQDTMLAPLRTRLVDAQRKLAMFGLKLVAVYQEGVLLDQAPKPKAEEEVSNG